MIFHCHVDWRVTKTCSEKDLSWTVGQLSGEPRTKVLAGILSMWSPSARVMANLGRHPELPWSAVGTQEVPARYMPFTRSLMMCPPAEIGAASYDFQTHKGWKIHGKKHMFFLNAVVLSKHHLQIPDWVSQYPKICWHTVKISGHSRLNYPMFGVYPPRLHLHSCYIPICFLVFFGVISVISPCIL